MVTRPRLLWAAVALASLGALPACSHPDPGTETTSIQVGGLSRTYIYHEPTSAPAAGSRKLVVSLHGNGGKGAQQEDLTAFSTLSDQRGFIAVYPDGIDKSWADGRGTTDADKQGVDDVAFVSALIDEFIKNHGADPKQVYVSGFSNGSMMTNRLGCELAGTIAAIGLAGGTMPELVSTTCAISRGMPVMAFHGTEDPFAPYAGGEVNSGAGGKVLSAKDTRAFWAGKAGCSVDVMTTPMPDTASDGLTVDRDESQGCKDGVEVVLFTVNGGGHTWPSSPDNLGESLVGKSTTDINASELLLDFFSKHVMP